MTWTYERGEGRLKHCWEKDYAGFKPKGRGAVGKCPVSISDANAEAILNKGVEVKEAEDDPFPARIYTYYEGVVYEAVPTRPGISYHGYPWRGDLPGRPSLPAYVKRHLEKQAEQAGQLRDSKQWMKKCGR
ncbi:MAG: hypothetical protein ACLFV4_03015 [Candidatus Hydrogenedentota bacterium]